MSAKSSHKNTREHFQEKYSRNMPAFLKKLAQEHQAPVHDEEDETEVSEK